MATQTTELRRPPKKQPKKENPSITRAKLALNPQSSTPLMKIKPEPSEITLKPDSVYRKSGYKVVEEVMDYFQWKKIPVSQEWLNGLARKMIEFAYLNEDSYHWMYFCKMNGLSVLSFYEYARRYPIIAQAKKDAAEIIAARRDVDALKMKLSGSVMLGTQAYHSPSFGEFSKEKASWAQPEVNTSGEKVISQYVYPEDYAALQKKVAFYEARFKEPDTPEKVPDTLVPDGTV